MKRFIELLNMPYFIAVLFAFKMMVYYSLIKVNRMEIVHILISVLIWGTIFLCFSKCGLKRKRGIFLTVYFLLSLLMFADTMYYNYYNQTVSIRQLWQARSVTAVPKSFIATLIPASFLLFVDIPFAYSCFKKHTGKNTKHGLNIRKELKYSISILIAIILTLVINPFHSTAIERVKNTEFFTNHVNDIYDAIADNISPEEMGEDEILEVLDEIVPEVTKPYLNGIGSGKNLVVIQLEAFQDFVIGKEYNGQEITPNINRLLEKDTLYYDNYYSNIGKGNTSDAEFSSLNSLYPVIEGESYRLYKDNVYHGLPWLLREQGYTATAVHGYKGEFWNREMAYPYQGFQDYISMEDMNQDEIIGMGISDKSMFKQLVPILETQQEPFFSFVITLTNHHPFIIEEKDQTLQLAEEDKGKKLGAYLQTVRYTDEAIGQFIEDLKTAGLYDNTVIAMYGDHHGLNCGMEDVQNDVSAFIGRTYDYDEMMNVPLIIHVPGSGVDETIHTTGGQIDFMPTIANIMGVDYDETFALGQDLTNATEGFVAFTSYLFEGSFVKDDVMFQISREGIFEDSRAWRIGTGEVLDASLYRDEYEKALLLKRTSKEILEKDLMSEYIKRDVIEN
ncbi:MAG: sulfatase-like hydrolase/transferase [Clostridiales bacterium]|nr:sulfatase-like hydrolase/transferase [Clostridiales bacterium]